MPFATRFDMQERRRRSRPREPQSDFLDFLHKLLDLLFLPITLPLRLTRNILTSPLTISLVLKLLLALTLVAASTAFSFLAVAAFWYAWSTGGSVEVEGWLTYGSRTHPTPHALIPLPLAQFQQDLAYDVGVELELVRPTRAEETGNFMLTLELRSARVPEMIVARAGQPSLAPAPLSSSYLSLPTVRLPSPPCLVPWPFRSLCPSRLLRRSSRRRRPAASKAVVALRKDLVEGVVVRPAAGDDVGTAFVSVGREDAFSDTDVRGNHRAEIRTTGWVVVRFTPHATGIRWLLTSSLLPPLLILPPLAIGLSLSSSLFAFVLINYFLLPRSKPKERDAIEQEKPSRTGAGDGRVEHDGLRKRLPHDAAVDRARLAAASAGASASASADGDRDKSDTTSETGTVTETATTETGSVASSDAWD
ncbi:hypothetical protein Q5752_003572 [Cryptotrichosporon argae]